MKGKSKNDYKKSMYKAICFVLGLLVLVIVIFVHNENNVRDNNSTIVESSQSNTDEINYEGIVNPDSDGNIFFVKAYVYIYDEYKGESLNMRVAPNKTSTFIREVPDGSYVKILGFSYEEPTWICVQYDNDIGWVLNKYIFSETTEGPTPPAICRVSFEAEGGLNLRTEPTYYSDKITTLKEGSMVELINADNNYENGYVYARTYDGKSTYGYLLVDYLEPIGRMD